MRRAPLALALVVVPLALAACGGGGGKHASTSSSVSPAAAVKAAALKATKAGSEHAVLKVSAVTGGQNVTLTGSGDFDSGTKQGSLHVDLSAAGISSTIDEVLTGTVVYLKSPLFSAFIPGGKTWLKIDLQRAASAQGLNLSALMAQNPTESLQALQGLKSVRTIGTEQLATGNATHYRAQIDAAKLPAAVRSSVHTGAYDVWVGDDGYVDRVRTSVHSGAGSQKATATVVVDLSGYGKSVKIDVPSAADTFTSTGSIPGLGG